VGGGGWGKGNCNASDWIWIDIREVPAVAPADKQAPLPQKDELPKKAIFQTLYVQSLPRENVGLFVLTSCMSILDI